MSPSVGGFPLDEGSKTNVGLKLDLLNGRQAKA
jgi:hypothetical protein